MKKIFTTFKLVNRSPFKFSETKPMTKNNAELIS